MKETFYFSHDYNTRSDEKIQSLIMKHTYAGYGYYWAIIEDLYLNANALRLDYERIAYGLRAETKTIQSIIEDFGLFDVNGSIISCKSVQRRLDQRHEKSAKARESAKKRWEGKKMRTHSERNAIKESKVKESKVNKNNNNITSNITIKKDDQTGFLEKFNEAVLEKIEERLILSSLEKVIEREELKIDAKNFFKFCFYWTEKSPKGRKMRFQKEKVFDLNRRIATWTSRSWNKTSGPTDSSAFD